MIIIGLTGSIGMGKSTASKMLRGFGVPVHCADEEVHRLLAHGGEGVLPVRANFPESYDTTTQSINRKILGTIVFACDEKRERLEALLHPLVREAQQDFLAWCKSRRAPVAVLDIPLLFETGAEKALDYTVCLSASNSVQRARVLTRSGIDATRLQAILNSQMNTAEKCVRADFIINTEKGFHHTRRKLWKITRQLTLD